MNVSSLAMIVSRVRISFAINLSNKRRCLQAEAITFASSYSYHHAEWTAPLLRKVLQCEHDVHSSVKTIRRCLKQSHYVWKRPGYALARQPKTWAQAKGGSKEVSARLHDG